MRHPAMAIPTDRSLPLLIALLLAACAAQQAIQQSELPRSGNVAMTEVNAADEQSYVVEAVAIIDEKPAHAPFTITRAAGRSAAPTDDASRWPR